MRFKATFLAGAVLSGFLGLSAPPASASASPPAASAEDSLRVPFVPTLNKPLHLHLVVTETAVRNKVEQPPETTTSDEELVFTERNAEGYVLRWTTLSVKVQAAPDRQALMERMAAVEIGKPLLIQTNANGAPLSVKNAGEVRGLYAASLDAMEASIDQQFADKPQADREAAHKIFHGMADSFRAMSDTQLAATVLRQPSSVFGFGDVTLARGRPVSFKQPLDLPLVGAKVTGVTSVELEAAGPDEIAIGIVTLPDPAETKAAVAAYLGKVLSQVAPEHRDELKAVLDKLPPMTLTDDMQLTLDAKTGLPRRAQRRMRMDMTLAAKTRTESYSFTD